MSQTLVFLAYDVDRSNLVGEARRLGGNIQVFEAQAKARRQSQWENLVRTTHAEQSTVLLSSVEHVPGQNWTLLVELSRLASIPDVTLRSLKEPSITLNDSQRDLLMLLKGARDAEVRRRTLGGVTRAREAGHGPGRPRVQVDVAAMATYRLEHSLRSTATAFNIGTSTCHRILAAYHQTQRSGP